MIAGAKERELVIPNDTKYLATVREAVLDIIQQSNFPAVEVNRIVLAVDEAVANIIEHAYEADSMGEAEIGIHLHADEDRFAVCVSDTGRTFDPAQIMPLNMAEHVRKGHKSGLGIFLMRKIMDEVSYRFAESGRNELRMTKFARPGARG